MLLIIIVGSTAPRSDTAHATLPLFFNFIYPLELQLRELRAAQRVLQDENDQRGQKVRGLESEVRNEREKSKQAAAEFEGERRQLQADKAEFQLHHRDLQERLAHERSVAAAISKQNDKLMEATQKATDMVVASNNRGLPSDGRSEKPRRSPGRRSATTEASSHQAGVPPAVVQSLQEELGMVRQHLRTLQQEVHDGAKRPPPPAASITTMPPRSTSTGRSDNDSVRRFLKIQETSWSSESRARKITATTPSSPRFGGALSQIDNLSPGKGGGFDSLLVDIVDIVDALEDES